MTAWEELSRTGEVGPECYALFVARAHRAARRYPAPNGHRDWTEDDVQELVQRVFEAGGRAIVVSLFGCANQDRLEALVTTVLQNRLKDDAKSTEVGKLRRRLIRLMADDARFEEDPPGRWHLLEQPSATSQVDRDHLVRAALGVRDVRLDLPLNEAGKTSARNISGLTAICAAVLTTAGGGVAEQDLAHAVAARCQLLTARPLPLSDLRITDLSAPPTDNPDIRRIATEIVVRLGDSERRAVLRMAGTAVPPAAIGTRQQKAICDRVAMLISQVVGDESRDDVLREVVTLLTPRPAAPSSITSSDSDEVAGATPSRVR